MALIEDRDEGREDGGYTRLFGDAKLGALISRLQATVISSGTELEKIILKRSAIIENIDNLSSQNEGIYIATKKTIKNSFLKSDKEPDFLIFEITKIKKHCYIVELKDGDTFDTKKARGEKDLQIAFQNHISNKIAFTTSIHVCSFNQNDKDKIKIGFKNVYDNSEIFTGQELCKLLGIDYQEIVNMRKEHQSKNFKFFLNSLLEIDSIKKFLKDS